MFGDLEPRVNLGYRIGNTTTNIAQQETKRALCREIERDIGRHEAGCVRPTLDMLRLFEKQKRERSMNLGNKWLRNV